MIWAPFRKQRITKICLFERHLFMPKRISSSNDNTLPLLCRKMYKVLSKRGKDCWWKVVIILYFQEQYWVVFRKKLNTKVYSAAFKNELISIIGEENCRLYDLKFTYSGSAQPNSHRNLEVGNYEFKGRAARFQSKSGRYEAMLYCHRVPV